MGLQELEGELRTEADPVRIGIRLVEPTRDEQHLAQLAELQLERRTWSGGLVAIRWDAVRLGRPKQAQGCWFGDDAQTTTSRAFNSLVDRLSSRLDARAVLRVEVLPDSQPEYAVRLVPWTSADPPRNGRLPVARGTLARSSAPAPGQPSADRGVLDCSGWSANPNGVAKTRLSRGPIVGAGADCDRLVARAGRRARLLPHRMGRRHPGMDLSRPEERSLVSARLLRLTCHARTASFQTSCAGARAGLDSRGDTAGRLRRAPLQDKLLLSGRSVPSRRAGRPGGQAGLCRAGGHRSKQSGGCSSCSHRRQGGRSQTGDRSRSHACRCQPRSAVGDEP